MSFLRLTLENKVLWIAQQVKPGLPRETATKVEE
jgi:hypothetical protein